MVQQAKPEDFVLATGRTRSVKELIEAAGNACDLDIE